MTAYLKQWQRRVFSQHGEDGIIEYLFQVLGEGTKFYVEIGATDGSRLSNTKHLRVNKQWSGLLFDDQYDDPLIGLHRQRITADNVNAVFAQLEVPSPFDFLSLDIDGIDWWVWRALTCRARVVVVEYNRHLPLEEDLVLAYNPEHAWDHTDYYSASLLSWVKLGQAKGYGLVGSCASNLFFVDRQELPKLPTRLQEEVDDLLLHGSRAYTHRPDPLQRPYVSGADELEGY